MGFDFGPADQIDIGFDAEGWYAYIIDLLFCSGAQEAVSTTRYYQTKDEAIEAAIQWSLRENIPLAFEAAKDPIMEVLGA